MAQGVNSWRDAAVAALAPGERAELASERPGEGIVAFLIRIARNSRRAKARQAAMGALFPAARDRLPGVVELAVDLLNDPGKFVRYEACRALAVALDPATLPALEAAQDSGVDVPWDGIACAIRAVRQGRREAFGERAGFEGRWHWVLQDELSGHGGRL